MSTRRLPLADAADICGLSRQRLRALCSAGRIPGARLDVIDSRAAWTVPVRGGRVEISEPDRRRGRPRKMATG